MPSDNLPDESTYRFIAVLNKKVPVGKVMNALGHMAAGLGSRLNVAAESKTNMCFLEYEDKDGGKHPTISHFPFIVLKADNGNQIRKVRSEAIARALPYSDFTSTMTVGTSQAQQDATNHTAEADLDYFGIVIFGQTAELKEFTGKFSLYQ